MAKEEEVATLTSENYLYLLPRESPAMALVSPVLDFTN